MAAPSYVYFIQAGDGGPVKVGVAQKPQVRLAALQASSPDELRLLGVVDGTQWLERRIHKRFAAHHVRGEWFKPVPALLAVARGEVPPLDTGEERKSVRVPDPNDVEMSWTDWTQRKDIDTLHAMGKRPGEIAEILHWDVGRVQLEMAKMARLGYFQGIALKHPARFAA